jgi:hypothetical protein
MPSKASKLLERMRKSPSGWKRKDLDRLYEGFGFVITPGAKHDIVRHPDLNERAVIPRHTNVNKRYIQHAVALIDKLQALENESKGDEQNE